MTYEERLISEFIIIVKRVGDSNFFEEDVLSGGESAVLKFVAD